MYGIVLKSIDYAMNDLVDARSDIPQTEGNEKILEDYDDHFEAFGEREAYYYQAFLDAEDRSAVDAPLFQAEYDGFEFEGPEWPDIETPWRLANELAVAAAKAGMDQDFLDELKQRFENTITEFWAEANRMLNEEKQRIEAEAAGQAGASSQSQDPGRRYGFWPVVAIGAVALVGAFGAAAGYSSAKSQDPAEYVDTTWWGRNKAAAKNLGMGFAVGVAAAALLILRVRR